MYTYVSVYVCTYIYIYTFFIYLFIYLFIYMHASASSVVTMDHGAQFLCTSVPKTEQAPSTTSKKDEDRAGNLVCGLNCMSMV